MIWKLIFAIPAFVASCIAQNPHIQYISLPDSLQQVSLIEKGYAYSKIGTDQLQLILGDSLFEFEMPGGSSNLKYNARHNIIYGYNSYNLHIYNLDSLKLIHATSGRMGGLVNQWANEFSHYALMGIGMPSKNFLVQHDFKNGSRKHIPLPQKYYRNFWVLNAGMVVLADHKSKNGISYGLYTLPQDPNGPVKEVFEVERKKSEQEERPIFYSLFAADSSQDIILNSNPVTKKIDVYQFKDKTKKTLDIQVSKTKWINLEKNIFYWHDADSSLIKRGYVEGTQLKNICTLGQVDSSASQFTTNKNQIAWLEKVEGKKRLAIVSKECFSP